MTAISRQAIWSIALTARQIQQRPKAIQTVRALAYRHKTYTKDIILEEPTDLLGWYLVVNGHGQHGSCSEHDGCDGVEAEADPARRHNKAEPPGPVPVQVLQERLVEPGSGIICPDCGQPLRERQLSKTCSPEHRLPCLSLSLDRAPIFML